MKLISTHSSKTGSTFANLFYDGRSKNSRTNLKEINKKYIYADDSM